MSIRELFKYRSLKIWRIHDMHICLLALFYILIVDDLFDPLNSLVLISSLVFYFFYTFMINDLVDWPYDIAAGKNRPVHKLSKNVFGGFILLIIFISVLHLLYLQNINYTITYSIAYLFATLYSAPVFRFKERNWIGIITDILIEKTLPVLAIFVYFNHFGMDTYIFLLTASLLQLVEIVKHQIYDYEADIKTGIRTFVVDIGIDRATRIFRYFITPFTAIFMILLSSLFLVEIPYATYIIYIIIAILIIYLAIFYLISKNKLDTQDKVFPFYMSPLYFIINNAFPLIFSFILTIVSNINIIFFIITLGTQYYLVEKLLILINKRVIIRTEILDG